MKVVLFKVTRDLRYFRKGQKVWAIFLTGALAASCIGRWRGKGRWVEGWVHWPSPVPGDSLDGRPSARWVGEVEVSGALAKRIETWHLRQRRGRRR